MKFHIELVSKSSGRMGVLQRVGNRTEPGQGKSGLAAQGDRRVRDGGVPDGAEGPDQGLQGVVGFEIKTPAVIMSTKSGSLPYISKEVFDLIMPASEQSNQILGINVQSTYEMTESLKNFPKGISSFVGLRNVPSLVHLNDYSVAAKLHHNEASGIPVFTKSGKKLLTPKSFMELLDSFAPDAAVLLGDTNLSMDAGKNRSRKSVNKTIEFMDKCLELKANSQRLKDLFLLAPIVGPAKQHDRAELLAHINKLEAVDGYSVEGLHKMGADTLLADESLLDTVKILLQSLRDDKLRLTLGAYSPLMVVDLVIAGVDVFDNTLPYLYAESHNALVFNFDVGQGARNTIGLHLSVTDEANRERFQPILEGCTCLACKTHTLAYIRHLFDSKELLGSILLFIHNFHHYNEFFKAIRKHVANDTLPELRRIIAVQCEAEDFEKVFQESSVGNANKSDGMVISKD